MKRILAAFFLGPFVIVVGLVMAVGGLGSITQAAIPASARAETEIPPVALAAYQAAAPLCPGLSWTVLAGIGKVETGHGTANGHHLDDTGQAVPAAPPLRSNADNGPLGHAYGPMQFLAGTWATYGPRVAPGANQADMTSGPVQNVNTSSKAAALLICDNAGGQITDAATLHNAVDRYSGSTDGYADDVTSLAALYAAPPPVAAGGGSTTGGGLRIVFAALHFIGIPYFATGDPGHVNVGHPPDTWLAGFQAGDPAYFGLECSGLTNVTMLVATGLVLNYCSADYLHDPRFAHVRMDQLEPGDFVLRGPCGQTGHIAIVGAYDPATGLATLIDAARHGTVVGFRPQQQVASWSFTDAVRYVG